MPRWSMSSTWARSLRAEVHDVPDDGEEVLGVEVLFGLVADLVDLVVLELPVDAEATHAAEAVAVVVEELLDEEGLALSSCGGLPGRSRP